MRMKKLLNVRELSENEDKYKKELNKNEETIQTELLQKDEKVKILKERLRNVESRERKYIAI